MVAFLVPPPFGVVPVLTFVASAVSAASTVALPGSAATGDVAYLVDAAESASDVSSVVPSGFTSIVNTVGGPDDEFRVVHSYRVLQSGDLGGTITGMNGTISNSKVLLIFRPSFTIGTITVSTYNAASTAGNPSPQTVTASGQTPPLIVVASAAGRTGTPAFVTQAPAFSSTILQGRVIVGHTIYNEAPANQSVDMADIGSVNILQSGYIRAAA